MSVSALHAPRCPREVAGRWGLYLHPPSAGAGLARVCPVLEAAWWDVRVCSRMWLWCPRAPLAPGRAAGVWGPMGGLWSRWAPWEQRPALRVGPPEGMCACVRAGQGPQTSTKAPRLQSRAEEAGRRKKEQVLREVGRALGAEWAGWPLRPELWAWLSCVWGLCPGWPGFPEAWEPLEED